MQLGMVGLGRMGGNMTTRLLRDGHEVVAYARDPASVDRAAKEGAVPAHGLEEVVAKLAPPRHVWLMIPSGAPVSETISALIPLLERDDAIIDGGNSYSATRSGGQRSFQRRASTLSIVGRAAVSGGWRTASA